MSLTRRRFLSTLGAACATRDVERLFAAQSLAPPPGGRLVRTMPLGRFDGRATPPPATLVGTSLDARQFTDLSSLTPDTLITPTERFFVRTASSPATTRPGRWSIDLGGRVRRPIELSSDDLAPVAESRTAQDFQPAVIDLAAMPIRVEKWVADSRVIYRVIGVRWGGLKPTRALIIRFRYDQPFVQVDDCPEPVTTTTWSLWSHLWRPAFPGRYQIVLGVGDRTIRTRRLDLFFYTSEVEIDEI